MAKKVMQIDVYEDGSMQILDAVKTEAAGKPIEAEETNWKKFHGYLKKNEAKDAIARGAVYDHCHESLRLDLLHGAMAIHLLGIAGEY